MSEPDTQFRQDRTPAATVLSAQEQQGLTVRVAPPPATRIGARSAALRRMVGQGLHVSLPAIEARLTIDLTAGDPRTAWPAALTLSGPDGAFEIEDGARLLRVLTGVDVEAADHSDDGNAEWLLSAILGRLDGTPFACCDRITRKALPASNEREVLRIVLRSGRHLVSTHLRADAATCVALLARTSWSPVRQPLSAYASLTTQTSVRIGSHVVSAGQLRTLAAGDILLPESTAFSVAGEGWLTFGRLGVHARYSAPGALTVLDVIRHPHAEGEAGSAGDSTISRRGRANMSKGGGMEAHHDEGEQRQKQGRGGDGQPAPAKAAAAGAKDVDQSGELDAVGVTLHFELGKVQMTLGEIRTLAAGSIVLFAGGSPESVAIVCSGRTLGRGEAVDVDGRLGIRISQWGHEGE
jgi:type III secretion protein Q